MNGWRCRILGHRWGWAWLDKGVPGPYVCVRRGCLATLRGEVSS